MQHEGPRFMVDGFTQEQVERAKKDMARHIFYELTSPDQIRQAVPLIMSARQGDQFFVCQSKGQALKGRECLSRDELLTQLAWQLSSFLPGSSQACKHLKPKGLMVCEQCKELR